MRNKIALLLLLIISVFSCENQDSETEKITLEQKDLVDYVKANQKINISLNYTNGVMVTWLPSKQSPRVRFSVCV